MIDSKYNFILHEKIDDYTPIFQCRYCGRTAKGNYKKGDRCPCCHRKIKNK